MNRLGTARRQLILELPGIDGDSLEDFLLASSNQSAMQAIRGWPQWPGGLVILDGPSGAGKTHLARIWMRQSSARWLTAADMWPPVDVSQALGTAMHAALDDADLVEDEPLLQLYNMIRERGGSLLLTASMPLGAWLPALPDLASRLKTAWTVHLGAPQDDLLSAVLMKQFKDRQIAVSPEVVDYLVRHMERTFAFARRLVHACDRASLHAKWPITLPLARAVLAQELDDLDTNEPTI